MADEKRRVSVCICTFKKPHLLKRVLDELVNQRVDGFTFSVVVADNDCAESAKETALDFAATAPFPLTYCVEPQQNIALARNRALANARGELIAFIDDDEYPVENWLCNLVNTRDASDADGVLGPVLPHFEEQPPEWASKWFFDRPTHATGYRIPVREGRTGNLLFRRSILDHESEAFRAEFRIGGEDSDFFERMMGKGCIFVWCNEAAVYELVPASRCTRAYILKRELIRGSNSFRIPQRRLKKVVTSVAALPAYALALPFLACAGDHQFMKYLSKLCYHTGRVLAAAGVHPHRKRAL